MMAAAFFLATLAPQAGALADLRVGEADGIARVMLVCEQRCSAAQTDGGPGSYRIMGLSDDVAAALPEGELVTGIRVTRDGDASILTIATRRAPKRVRLSRCEDVALCFDLDLTQPSPPPTIASMEARLEMLEANRTPTARLRTILEAETGEGLGEADCAKARRTLQDDAWALDAFRIVALCRALAGAPGEADGYLARLQTLEPSEATARLRALIALPPEQGTATRLR